MIFWYLQRATKDSDEPAQGCILNSAFMATVCQACKWINFVSHDSNHNLKRALLYISLYKQTNLTKDH